MKRTRVIYVLLLFCSPLVSFSAAPSGKLKSVSICKINTTPSIYVGSKSEVHALYETDGMNYSYLHDPLVPGKSCESGGIIEIGYVGQTQRQSVSRFREIEKSICEKRGKGALCVLTADVRAEVQVLKDKDGLYVNLIEVWGFRFHNRK